MELADIAHGLSECVTAQEVLENDGTDRPPAPIEHEVP